MGVWKKREALRWTDFIPFMWVVESQKSISKVLDLEKKCWWQLSYLLCGATLCVDWTGCCLMIFHCCYAPNTCFWPPLLTCVTGLLCHATARAEVRRKYQIDYDKSLCSEFTQTVLCPCGLAILRAQQSAPAKTPPAAEQKQETEEPPSEKKIVIDYDDDDEIPAETEEFEMFMQQRLKNSRSRFEASDLALSALIAKAYGGENGNSAYDRMTNASGFPSGFPEQWFEEFHNIGASSHLIDTWETVSKHQSASNKTQQMK
jgi:hypothetical protein